MPRKKTSKNYWNADTDNAIKEFLLETNSTKREEIFDKKIYPCFVRLAEVAAAKFGQYLDREDAIIETVSHLYSTLLKHINYEKKHTAYSYLTRSAFTYVMQRNDKVYRKRVSHESVDVPLFAGGDNSTNIIDIEKQQEHDNSPYPNECDFDRDKFIKRLIDKVGIAEVKNVTENRFSSNMNTMFARKKIMLALTMLGSEKFHKKLRHFNPYKNYMKNRDRMFVGKDDVKYLWLLSDYANEIYRFKD